LGVKRAAQALGALLVVLGVFWAGRESSHGNGLSAFWEHWWCAVPLVVIVLGVASVIAARRATPAA
jgi:hypothetical protein